jgi:hypothetical protein
LILSVASVAKTLMLDIFRPGLPMLVTAGFASGYVMSLSIANLSGSFPFFFLFFDFFLLFCNVFCFVNRPFDLEFCF